MAQADSVEGKRLWLIYFPRAAHHLFMRMFSAQDNLEMIEVFSHLSSVVIPTVRLAGRAHLTDAEGECQRLRQLLRTGYNQWMSHMRELEATGKRILNSYSVAFHISPAIQNQCLSKWNGYTSDNHVQTWDDNGNASHSAYWQMEPDQTSLDNPTIFPDSFLCSHVPIMLIRHPALAFPSTIRVASIFFEENVGETFMNLILRYKWHVMLFEWFKNENSAPEPVVLDADDLMYDPDALKDFCKNTGLNADDIKYEWVRQDIEATYTKEEIFQDVLARSTGVVQGKSSEGIDIEAEFDKWVDEFGDSRANMLKRRVEDAMEDYLFLKERSVGAKAKQSHGRPNHEQLRAS